VDVQNLKTVLRSRTIVLRFRTDEKKGHLYEMAFSVSSVLSYLPHLVQTFMFPPIPVSKILVGA
jgi:hypothetical protein